jgi:hypothetical protein
MLALLVPVWAGLAATCLGWPCCYLSVLALLVPVNDGLACSCLGWICCYLSVLALLLPVWAGLAAKDAAVHPGNIFQHSTFSNCISKEKVAEFCM